MAIEKVEPLPLPVAVAATRATVDALEAGSARPMQLQKTASSTFGRCVLGLAGLLEYATAGMQTFLREREPSEQQIVTMHECLTLVAEVVDDEDNATFFARIGAHPLLMRLMEHEDERIQDAAAEVVGVCTSNSTGISFPHRARQLGSVERPRPLSIPLPLDERDQALDAAANSKCEPMSVLIRQVPTRMTGQPKTGYLLWGAAIVLARWVHLHRELFFEKCVLEVGSGLGLGGIIAARYAHQTVLTDYQEDTCRALEYNVQLNKPFIYEFDADKPQVAVEHLDWDSMDSIHPECKMDIVVASDIICEPSTAEGFLRVVRHRLSATGVAYLMNADSHSRFGVIHLHKLLAESDFVYTITPVHELPDGKQLLDTVSDAQELSYEYYEIRLPAQ